MSVKHVGFLIMNMKNGGGTERVTSIISNGIVKNGFRVSIISCNKGYKSCYELDDRVELFSLRGEEETNPFFRKFLCLYRLAKYVENENLDIVIAVDVALYSYLYPIQCLLKCKCIAWEHFNYYFRPTVLTKIGRDLAVKNADCVVVLGKRDLENYKNHYTDIKRIEYIYNPLAFASKEKASMDKKRVIAVGRLTEQKGFDLLINIWSKIENKYQEWSLDIFGEGPLRTKLQQQIDDLSLSRISLKGYSFDIRREMLNSSIFAFSSRYEGFGLVLIEAQEVGLPCISFDCKEGPAEIIEDGKNGFLIEHENVEMFARKLERLIQSESLRCEFSQNADINLRKYNVDVIIHKWVKLLNDL